MGWFKKKLKKITKVVDPVGNQLRKATGGSYGDPMNWYQSKPKQATPYQAPPKRGLQADPGTGGPTLNLGGGGNYTPNPFAGQMAQAAALRGGAPMGQPGMAPPIGQVGMAPPQNMQNMMVGGRPGQPPNMGF